MAHVPRIKSSNRRIAAIERYTTLRTLGLAVTALIIFVVVWGAIYWILGIFGYGIESTFEKTDISFLDCLHFSCVTITSLGYGDYRPLSWSRLAAGTEVAAGLVLFGIFIARLTSTRQELLVQRLIRGQIEEKLQYFRNSINEDAIELEHVLGIDLGENFHPDEKQSLLKVTNRSWEAVLGELSIVLYGLARYLRYEVSEGEFFEVAPQRVLGRILGSLRFVLRLFCDEKFIHVFEALDRGQKHAALKSVSNVNENALAIATWLRDETDNEGIEHLTERVFEAVRQVRQSYNFALLKEGR